MPPRKRKTKATENSADGDAFIPSDEAPQRKKTLPSEPKRKRQSIAHVDDDDAVLSADECPMDWFKFQEALTDKSKSDMEGYLEKFRNDLKASRETLLGAFDKSRDALESTGSKQAKSIDETCKRIAADERSSSMDRLDHPLFKAGQQIFTNCHAILEHHDRTNTESVSMDISPLGDKWQADHNAVQEVLEYGRQYGEKLVDCAVTLDSNLEVLKVDRDQLQETGNMAIDIYKKSAEAIRGHTWAYTVKAQLNAVTALMETAPK